MNEEWPNKWLMIGLNLMYLLANNQHAQFHMVPHFSCSYISYFKYFHVPYLIYLSTLLGTGTSSRCGSDNILWYVEG